MTRLNKAMCVIATTSAFGFIAVPTAQAQQHSINEQTRLQAGVSSKAMHSALDTSSGLDKSIAVAPTNAGLSRTASALNPVQTNASAYAGKLKPLMHKPRNDHHVDPSVWQAAFDGIEVKATKSRGTLTAGKSLLTAADSKAPGVLEVGNHGLSSGLMLPDDARAGVPE